MTHNTESAAIKRILDETDALVREQRRAKYGPCPVVAEAMRKLVDTDPATLEAYLRYIGKLTLHAPQGLQ